ncbi:MAG: LPS export ABC transporter periplasmic protein LptC [Methyloligellaceae bacterium]
MTIEANHPLVASRSRALVIALQAERQKALAAARRHSRWVRILKVLLPVCAVGVIGLYFVSSKIKVTFGDIEASVGRIEVNRERLRMVNPKLEGVNKQKGLYVMTADYAEQDVSKPSTIFLHAVKAETTSPKQGWSRMTAPKGTFYTQQEKLDLFGDIKVTSSNGMTARLTSANIELNTNMIRSQEPVRVEFINGWIDAKTLEIDAGERVIFFRGDVRAHVKKRPEKASK